MKTKTDAAKVLLENGWSYEELGWALGVAEPEAKLYAHSRPGMTKEAFNDHMLGVRRPNATASIGADGGYRQGQGER